MQQRFAQPCRAIRIHAAAGRLAFLTDDVAAANRASAGHTERLPCAPCSTTRTIFGMTSPLRSTSTVSPISTPRRAISSSL